MGMKSVILGTFTRVRDRAENRPVELINRFYEEDPTNLNEQVALIERPALVELLDSGDGPSRRIFFQSGFASDALFHISGLALYKHVMETNRTITTSTISGTIDDQISQPDMAATENYLFITDGSTLQYTNGTAALAAIATPDDIPMISLDVFNGYILCVQADSDRFYWIEPDAITIDPLNFATAERQPDHILQVRAVGDEFWLLGRKTIEVWRATGDADAPFQRLDARRFDHGIWGGTALRLRDSVVVVGDDGTVYNIAGQPEIISNNSIAERIRDAIFSAFENNED